MGECWYGSFSGGFGDFSLTTVSGPVLGPTQPLVQLVPGAFPPRVKLQGRAVGYALAFSHLV